MILVSALICIIGVTPIFKNDLKVQEDGALD